MYSFSRSSNTEVASDDVSPRMAAFIPNWEDEEELKKQLLQEARLIRSVFSGPDDKAKLAFVVQRYPTNPYVSIPLDSASTEALKGSDYCISRPGLTKDAAELKLQKLRQLLPNVELDLIEVRDASGQQRFALKGLSAHEATSLEEMQRIQTMAEERGAGKDTSVLPDDQIINLAKVSAISDKTVPTEVLERARSMLSLKDRPETLSTSEHPTRPDDRLPALSRQPRSLG